MKTPDRRTSASLKLLAAVALAGGLGFYAVGSAGVPQVTMAAAAAPPRVEVVYPRRATIVRRMQTNATLNAFEETDLYAKVSGFLSEVRVDIGDHVKAGEVLAVIYAPEMEKELDEANAQLEAKRKLAETARRQIDRNKADLSLQESTIKRQASLNKSGWVSDQGFDDIRAKTEIARADVGVAESNLAVAETQVNLAAATVQKTQALLKYAKLVAPFDGTVAQRLVNRGDLVQSSTASRTTPLFKVQRIDTIRVFCDVPEAEALRVHPGDAATIKPLGFDGAQLTGTITRMALRLDPETRNMRTEIDLPNPGERLYPNMYAEVSLEVERHPDVLTLPSSAIGTDRTGPFVYAIKDDRIDRLPIQTGLSDNGQVEVVGGLPEQTSVAAVIKAAPPAGTVVQPSTTHGNP